MISKREDEEARPQAQMRPAQPEVTVTVSIPVTVGGYTGQRDAWEEYTNQYEVEVDGSNVVLKKAHPSIATQKITIPRHALYAAIGMLGQQKPVLRETRTPRFSEDTRQRIERGERA